VGGGADTSGLGAPLDTKWGTARGEGTSRPTRASGGRCVRPDPWDPRTRGRRRRRDRPSVPTRGRLCGEIRGDPGGGADGGTRGAGSPSRHTRPSVARRWRRAPTDVVVQAAGMAAADSSSPFRYPCPRVKRSHVCLVQMV
jgi:hypothetical protein